MASQAGKEPQDSTDKVTSTAIGAVGCSMPSPRSCRGIGACNSKAHVGSVLEGHLVSTFWSLSLRDKEESM